MHKALLRAGLALGLTTLPALAFAQKALVYCPPQDQTGCNAVVTALTGSGYPGGVDRAYDGSGGTVDIRTVDLFGYSVFVVPARDLARLAAIEVGYCFRQVGGIRDGDGVRFLFLCRVLEGHLRAGGHRRGAVPHQRH